MIISKKDAFQTLEIVLFGSMHEEKELH